MDKRGEEEGKLGLTSELSRPLLLSRFLLGSRVKDGGVQKHVPSRPSAGRIGGSSGALAGL